MKRLIFAGILFGLLLVSLIGFVSAAEGSNTSTDSTACNLDSDCILKFSACSCSNTCILASQDGNIDCARACTTQESDKTITSCKCENNKCVGNSNSGICSSPVCEGRIDTGKKDSNGCEIYSCPVKKSFCGNGICDNTPCSKPEDCPSQPENNKNCPQDCCKSDSDCLQACPTCGIGVDCPCYPIKCINGACRATETTCQAPTCKNAVDTGKKDSKGCEIYSCPSPISTCKKGCVCSENTVSCPTDDESVVSTITIPGGTSTSKTGSGNSQGPSTIQKPITISKKGDGLNIKVGETETTTSENVTVQDSKILMTTSNGRNAEIKVMPETASEKAVSRLGELGFNITLKEVGKGNETKPVYNLEAEKDAKVLGFIKTKAKVSMEVDAETGDIISVHKPWWSFLASGV